MIRPVAAVVAFALLGGCGYKLGEIRPTPMRSVRTLAVPTFKNRTYEPRVEVLLADTLIKTLQEDGTYTIERRSIRSVQNNVLATAEFGLHLDIAYEVADRVTGSLLKKGKVRGDTSFFSSSDIQTTERQAIPVAARDAAIELTTEIAEGW